MIKLVKQNLLTFDGYICHQCYASNDFTGASGLAHAIFQRWPHTNIYKMRQDSGDLGKAVIIDNVVNLIAQRYPGKPNHVDDNYNLRLRWFKLALKDLQKQLPDKSTPVAFPYGIGCGLAAGAWTDYEGVLLDWATYYQLKNICLCKLG